ncbi:MAG: hypothetical protein J0L94_11770 [Rhodothermia bacterium]|nr:hypothetical protein [Rhodothermia bacterium]
MIVFLLLILFGLLVLFDRIGGVWFTKQVHFWLVSLIMTFGLTITTLLLVFEFSLFSALTGIALLPFAIMGLWQMLRLSHYLWPSRYSAWFMVALILFSVWYGTQRVSIRIHPDQLVESLFVPEVAPTIQSIDPNARRIVRL